MSNPLVTMTTTMGQMQDQLRLYTKLQTYFAVGGVTGEPMASMCNRVMQMLFTKRMPWRFNVAEFAPFPWGSGNFMVTQQGFQDIKFAGASVFVLLPATAGSPNLPIGGVGVDLAATTVGQFAYGAVNGGTNAVSIDPTTGIISVQTLDPHPYTSANLISNAGPQAYLSGLTNPAFNSVYSYSGVLATANWTQGYNFLAIQGAYNFTLQGTLGEHYGSITQVDSNPLLAGGYQITVFVANTMSAGDIMTFSNVVTNTALNGAVVTLTAATSTYVVFTFPTALTTHSDTGYIFAAPSGAPGIFNFSWLQSADVYDISNQSFPMPVDQLKAVHRKSKEYTVTGDRWEIAPVVDYNNGVIKFRLTEPPGNYPWGIGLSIQKRAPKMSKPGDVFPWPDELSFVLFEMLLWQASRLSYGGDAAETQLQMQIASQSVMAALESEDREDNTMAYAPDISFMSGTGWG